MLNEGTNEEGGTPFTVPHEEINLPALAARAFEATAKDAPAAAKLLEQWARADATLARAILDPHLPSACWHLIVQQCRYARRVIWEAPRYSASGKGERVAHLATENARALLDMTLPLTGEPLLRNATREQVEEAAIYYEKRAANMQEKCTWLRLIAKRAKDGIAIGEQFTEAALRKLQAQVIGKSE